MKKRPISITIIAWFLIISSLLTAVLTIFTLHNPTVKELMSHSALSIPTQITIMYISLAISFICGVGMLKQQNWARYLYVIFSIIGFSINLITSAEKMAIVPGIIILIIIIIFLFLPKANDYFSGRYVAKNN